jgi:hypothetical protein
MAVDLPEHGVQLHRNPFQAQPAGQLLADP